MTLCRARVRRIVGAAMVPLFVFALGPAGARGQAPGDEGMLIDPNAVPMGPGGMATPPPRVVRPMPRSVGPTTRPSDARPVPPAGPESLLPPMTQPAGPLPEVKVDEPVYDFGKLLGVDSVSHTFRMRNVGEGELRIESVRPTCGCTVAGEWAKTCPPGGTWEVPITLRTAGYDGAVSKHIVVMTNDPRQRQVSYTIKGEIRPRFSIKPMRTVNIPGLQKSSVSSAKLTITNQLDKPVKFGTPQVSSPSFKVEMREVKEGREYELQVTTVPPLNDGTNHAQITIETDCEQEPKLTIPIYATVTPRLTLSPLVIPVPSPTIQDARRALMLRNSGEKPVTVKEVQVSVPQVKSEVTVAQEGKLYQIWLTIPKGTEIPSEGIGVTVVTDDAETPTFTAQIRGYKLPNTRPALVAPGPRPAAPAGAAGGSVRTGGAGPVSPPK